MSESEGYRAIAQYFAKENGIVILNRFRTLNIQNLLYMQAELFRLEDELQCIAIEDSKSPCSKRQNYRYSFIDLQDSLKGKECFQWTKMLEIREKLKRYSTNNSDRHKSMLICPLDDAIIRYDNLGALPKPPRLEVSNIRRILKHARNTKFLLKDIDVGAWNAQAEEDLVALSSSDLNLDPFANWARSSFLIHLHRMIGFKWVVSLAHLPSNLDRMLLEDTR